MVVDTSALLAILLNEREAEAFARAIEADAKRSMSAVNFLETSIVIESRRGPEGVAHLDLLVSESELVIEPFTHHDARLARRAYRRYGKGVHPAGLNFGDCAAYALAKSVGERLLFKGDDFARTDVDAAISPP